MDEEIYLHGISAQTDLYDSRYILRVFESILKSGELLSLRLQGIGKNSKRIGFNGLDYISLCDYEKRNLHFPDKISANSYTGYILYSLSLAFPKDKLDVIEPIKIEIPRRNYRYYFKEMEKYGMSENERYTDLADEAQVKDRIPLSLMNGITIPVDKIYRIHYDRERYGYAIMKEVLKIEKLLAKYHYNVPIYDINTMESLQDGANIKRLVKEYYKK